MTKDTAEYKQDVLTSGVQFDDQGERLQEGRSVCTDARVVAFSDGGEKFYAKKPAAPPQTEPPAPK